MPYCAAKAAVDMFVKSIALELGPKGVRVNLVRYEEKRSEVKWITLKNSLPFFFRKRFDLTTVQQRCELIFNPLLDPVSNYQRF